jgi:ATP dependent DNA ligase-like protein
MTVSAFWRGNAAGVRLITRAGNDFSSRFPFIAMAVGKLPVRSCLIDGEAIVCDENGLAVFELIRRHGALATAVHCAFDLLELDGNDLRRHPIEKRKELLAELVKGSHLSIVLNKHFEDEGAVVYREACRLGCEGIVSKRLGSPYRSGRAPHWVPAVRREAEGGLGPLNCPPATSRRPGPLDRRDVETLCRFSCHGFAIRDDSARHADLGCDYRCWSFGGPNK